MENVSSSLYFRTKHGQLFLGKSKMLFLIDLPRIDDSKPSTPEIAKGRLTFFGQELLYFLEAMGLEQDVIRGVLQFDFAATENLAFVHTM